MIVDLLLNGHYVPNRLLTGQALFLTATMGKNKQLGMD